MRGPHPPEQVTIGNAEWALDRATRELLWGYQFPNQFFTCQAGLYAPLDAIRLNPRGMPIEEYECIHHHPYLTLGYTESYGFLLISLIDSDPTDPLVYYLDHDGYQEIEAARTGLRVSRLLRGLTSA